jgi:hypothetical protein
MLIATGLSLRTSGVIVRMVIAFGFGPDSIAALLCFALRGQ